MVSLPFLIAAYRKLKALSMLLAELGTSGEGSVNPKVQRLISEVIPALSVVAMLLFVSALSASILPPANLLVVVSA